MGDSTIEWTDFTFNPWLGCAKVHAGCTHCYAEKHQAVNMRQGGKVRWGEVWQGGMRVVVADSTRKKPYQWAREAAAVGQRRRVFCASLADVLEDPRMPTQLPESWPLHGRLQAREQFWRIRSSMGEAREQLWDIIRKTAHVLSHAANIASEDGAGDAGLDWLLLTKRPENWSLVPEDVRPLVWLGTSVSDQKTADGLVPRLLQAQGFRYRFLSVEPLVGPVDISAWLMSSDGFAATPSGPLHRDDGGVGVDWVIVGGESGPNARSCRPEWVRSLRDQCESVGAPFFFKQWGGRDKKAAGKELDGRTWLEFPKTT